MPEPAEQPTPYRPQELTFSSTSGTNSTRTSVALPGADGPAGERMPPISLGDHEQVGVIAVTSTDA
ncbi:hypothetical protein, partial [Streptomyces brasiliscabiei]